MAYANITLNAANNWTATSADICPCCVKVCNTCDDAKAHFDDCLNQFCVTIAGFTGDLAWLNGAYTVTKNAVPKTWQLIIDPGPPDNIWPFQVIINCPSLFTCTPECPAGQFPWIVQIDFVVGGVGVDIYAVLCGTSCCPDGTYTFQPWGAQVDPCKSLDPANVYTEDPTAGTIVVTEGPCP